MKEEVGETNVTKVTRIKAKDLKRPLTAEEKQRVLEYRRRKALEKEKEEAEKAKLEKEQAKEKKLVIAGFIMSLLALIVVALIFMFRWIWLPFVGIGLGIVAMILLIPLIVKSAKRKKLPAKNSGLFLVSCILMTIGLVMNIILCIIQCVQASTEQQQQEITYLEEVDVNGLKINNACNVVRSKGWSVLEVVDEGSTNKSDCSDLTNTVTSSRYYNKNSSSNPGKVVLYFVGTTKDTATSDTKAQGTDSGKVDATFRATMAEYEEFIDRYVSVIKAHKADPTNEALIEQYNSMTVQYNEWVTKINQIDTSKLSATDREYYNTVVNRCNQKVNDASKA